MHGDDVVAPSRIAKLREFAGPHPPDAYLRRVLVRAAGNLDHAASLMLADPAYTNGPAHPCTLASPEASRDAAPHHSALPPPASAAKMQILEKKSNRGAVSPKAAAAAAEDDSARARGAAVPAASGQHEDDGERQYPNRNHIRKAAWRSFYKSNYNEALKRYSSDDKESITAFITDLWKDLGDQRHAYYNTARDELLRKAGMDISRANNSNPVVAASEKQAMQVSSGREAETIPMGDASEQKSLFKEETRNGVQGSGPICAGTRVDMSPVTPAAVGKMSAAVRTEHELEALVSPHVRPDDNSLDPKPLADSIDGKTLSDPVIHEPALVRAKPAHSYHDVEAIDVDADSSRPQKIRRLVADDCCVFTADAPSVVNPDCMIAIPDQVPQPNVAEWPKEICSRMLVCKMMVSGVNIVKAGDIVELEAAPQKAGFGKKSRAGRPGANPIAQSTSSIVRFSLKNRELGRLPVQFAKVLAPALSGGLVQARARVIEAPRVSRVLSEIILDVTVLLGKIAFFPQDQEENPARMIAVVKNSDRKVVPDDGSQLDFDRLSVVNLISSLGLCQPVHNVDTHAQLGPNIPADDGSVSEGKTELYFDTVQTIEAGMVAFIEPPALRCSLRDYQKVGVSWMLAREKHGSSHHSPDDVLLHPLWKRKVFPDGVQFYANGTTGGLSLTAPLTSAGGPFGGILADEMGLGKTIECIALIVSDYVALDMEARGKSDLIGEVACGAGVEERCNTQTANTINIDDVGDTQSNSTISGACHNEAARPRESQANESTPPSGTLAKRPRRSCRNVFAENRGSHGKCMDSQVAEDENKPASLDRNLCNDTDGDGNGDCGTDDAENDSDDDFVNPISGEHPLGAELNRKEDESDDDYEASSDPQVVEKEQDSCKLAGGISGVLQKTVMSRKSIKYPRLWLSRAAPAKGGQNLVGGTLLVVPMSMIQQWLDELSEHVDSQFLRCRAYYGQQRGSARAISVLEADVVITSYGTLAAELPDGDVGDTPSKRPIFQVSWRRVILDEAHSIKSRVTKWAKACFLLKAQYRWCVTGTPIQNHVNDVFSLLHFLRVEPWSSWSFWQRGILNKIESNEQTLKIEAMSTIRDILSPLTLRRLKSTVGSDGKPLVQLSKRDVQVVKLVPSTVEADFYGALHRKTRAQFDTYVAQGKVLNHYGSVLELLLRLRQACDHPYLIFAASQNDSDIMNDRSKLFETFSGANSSTFVDSVMQDALSGKLADCPICLDVMDDATAVRKCGHAACRSCLFQVLSRRGSAASCPVCRVGIESKKDLTTLPRMGGSRFPMNLRTNWQSSAKLDALMDDVREMENLRRNSNFAVGKMVIMSQFTSFLDLLEIALGMENMRFLRFDGTLSQKKRARILDSFAKDDEKDVGTANVMLMSLKSGGVGLNLVSASRLCLADPSWNPQVDYQAMARVHRHGQTRDVVIKRYVISNSVEERLLDVQQRKVDVSEGALSTATDDDKRQARLSEIKMLFS